VLGVGELLHVAHRVAVADDLGPGVLVGFQRFAVVDGRQRIVERDLIAFDRVGTADGARLQVTPQVVSPAPGLAERIS